MASESSPRESVAKRIVALLLGFAALAALIGLGFVVLGWQPRGIPAAASTPSPHPTGEPSPAAARPLLDAAIRGTGSCFVSLQADGIEPSAVRQRDGGLYRDLPVPRRSGSVFAGWYSTAAGAAAHDVLLRVNGSHVVACGDSEQTLYGAWMSPAESASADTRVPILMYHQFTTKPGGETGWLRLNYTYVGAFTQQIDYLSRERFYTPTWDELDAFIDGALYLPPKSVVVTDDDADPTWESLGVPVVTTAKVLTTSFVITAYRQAPSPSTYVLQRSHTNDMHTAGANGRGRMVNYSVPQIVADLHQSVKVLGVAQVLAYPYGQYNAAAEEGLRESGFQMAVTTAYGYVHPGSDKLELPRVRISYGMSMAQFEAAVGR